MGRFEILRKARSRSRLLRNIRTKQGPNGKPCIIVRGLPCHNSEGITGMLNRLGKALTCAALAASAIGLSAVPSQASPARPMYFNYGCDYGHACIRLAVTVQNSWWNADHCGDNPIHDY